MKELITVLLFTSACCSSQVTLTPARVVAIPDWWATFSCSHATTDITSIQWLLNGSTISAGNELVGLLQLRQLTLEYNSTTVQCRATIRSGETFISNIGMLFVQGLLHSVGNLRLTHIFNDTLGYLADWEAPFSLLNDTSYCVSVIEHPSLSVVRTECGVNQTMLEIQTISPEAIACSLFNVTVMPVNIVGNGTASSTFQSLLDEGQLGIQALHTFFDGENMNFRILLTAPVCTASATILGVYNTMIIQQLPISANFTDMLEFSGLELETDEKHVYIATFQLSNNNGAVNETISISTHAVQKITINSLVFGVVYAEGSTARGVLTLLLFLASNESIDYGRSVYAALERGSSMLPFPIPSNLYLPLAYDILSDGLLQTGWGYPANQERVYLLGSNIDPTNFRQPLSIDTSCSMTSQALTIHLTCTCRHRTGVTGFQVIFQRNDEHNYQSLFRVFVRSGSCSRSVVHQVEESGTYGVSVFPIRENSGIVNSFVSFFEEISLSDSYPETTFASAIIIPDDNSIQAIITGASVGLSSLMLLITAIVVCGIILLLYCHKVGPKSQNGTSTSPKETELVYEEIKNPEDSITCTQNVVYGINNS